MIKYCNSALVDMHEYKQTLTHNDVEMLKLSIKYPTVNLLHDLHSDYLINSQIIMSINEFIGYANYLYFQAIEGYNEAMEQGFLFHAYEAIMEYTITYNNNCFLSMYNDKYEFTGGAHGSTIRSSLTFDICSGQRLSLEDFFQPGFDYRRLILDEITKQANIKNSQEPQVLFEDYKSLIIKTFDERSFNLSPQGITFYFQQYDIAPYSTGIVEFTIPYSTIGWQPQC